MPFAPAFARAAATGGLSALLCLAAPLGAQEVPRPFALQPGRGAEGPKNPTTARVLGIVPGLGHLYAGEPGRGALVAGTFVGLVVIGTAAVVGDCTAAWTEPDCGSSVVADVLVPVALIGTIGYSVWDAGRAAHRTNSRRGTPVRLTLGMPAPGAGYRVGMRVGF